MLYCSMYNAECPIDDTSLYKSNAVDDAHCDQHVAVVREVNVSIESWIISEVGCVVLAVVQLLMSCWNSKAESIPSHVGSYMEKEGLEGYGLNPSRKMRFA